MHLGYAFQASSWSTRASSGARAASQVGALLQYENSELEAPLEYSEWDLCFLFNVKRTTLQVRPRVAVLFKENLKLDSMFISASVRLTK